MSRLFAGIGGTLQRLSIGAKFSVGATLCAIAVCAASLAITVYKTEAELSRIGMEKIDQNMKTLWAMGRATGWPARTENGKLVFGETVVNDNHTVVDQVKEIGGGTATIFQLQGEEFVRVTTNVPSPNGGRAVGTKLARNAAYAANINGKGFRGRVEILGVPYFTGYDPIKDASGRVIGIMYVGVLEAEFTAAIRNITWEAVAYAALALIGAVLLLGF